MPISAPRQFCVDCRYIGLSIAKPEELSFARCTSPHNIAKENKLRHVSPGPQHQEPERLAAFCDTARNMADYCGPDGVWFTPKTEP